MNFTYDIQEEYHSRMHFSICIIDQCINAEIQRNDIYYTNYVMSKLCLYHYCITYARGGASLVIVHVVIWDSDMSHRFFYT